MNLHDVPVLVEMHLEAQGLAAQGWTFVWGRGTSTFGTTSYTRKRIKVSKPMAAINTEERVERLILHEIAHALTPDDPGHGWEWKAKCEELGLVNESRLWGTSDTVQVPATWTLSCPTCGEAWGRSRIPKHPLTGTLRTYLCPHHRSNRTTLVLWRTADGQPYRLTESIAANRKETP